MYRIEQITQNINNCVKVFTVVIKFDDCEDYTFLNIPISNLNYENLVSMLISRKYNADKMQAVINNYLLDNDEPSITEFNEMQDWRKISKTIAKDILSRIDYI